MEQKKFEKIYKEVSKLSGEEKILILSKLLTEVFHNLRNEPESIYNIKGLGKEIWKGIDAQEYVNSERDAWQ